ncbi:(d)CMP kinase [candidate division KSB1 bacterium]|nr:(d)CMP kinase [candidate division KSB1 bacterium]RQW01107.1 MAG: (d)CMP kinase [candidate division KSB1 bacterium]
MLEKNRILATTNKIIIAIDGPAGSGKSSTATRVAEVLDYLFLDTGAMYRAVTFLVLRDGGDPCDLMASSVAAQHADIQFQRDKHGQHVFLNGQDVTQVIRKPLVTNNIAPVAANPAVREILVEKQRDIGKNGGIVAEGRDIGTVVFTHAELKIFMVASMQERARRRAEELREQGIPVDFERLVREIKLRDKSDSTRQHGALRKAPDALLLDTSNMTIEEQVAFIVREAQKRGA